MVRRISIEKSVLHHFDFHDAQLIVVRLTAHIFCYMKSVEPVRLGVAEPVIRKGFATVHDIGQVGVGHRVQYIPGFLIMTGL